jgi:hypothetical protein
MHRSSEPANEAVAAWQQHQFVCCSMQLTPGARRLAEVLSRNEGKRNAHLHGFRHHHGSGHWSWRLFLAPSGGRCHTASTAPQIASRLYSLRQRPIPCGSSQPRSDLCVSRPGLSIPGGNYDEGGTRKSRVRFPTSKAAPRNQKECSIPDRIRAGGAVCQTKTGCVNHLAISAWETQRQGP